MAIEQSIIMGIALAWLFVRMLEESQRNDERAERYERVIALQHGAVLEVDRAAVGLDLDVAADDDIGAERDVAADDQALGVAQRRRARREARLEVRDELEVVRIEVDVRRRAVARRREDDAAVVGHLVGVRAQREQVVRRLDRREAVARDRSARAPSITPSAAPIAVSIWKTSGDAGSDGSTVLTLRISGRPSMPPRRSSSAATPAGRTRSCSC